MTATDPLATIWDALGAADCEPHGQSHDFRARCPAHNGDNVDALHVSGGLDGRAVLWCHAHQCTVEEIVEPLGLDVRDLFPAGHQRARRRQLATRSREDFVGNAKTAVNVLAALERLGERWRVSIDVDECPYCVRPHAQLVIASHDRKPFAHCEAACTARMFTEALAGRIADQDQEMTA